MIHDEHPVKQANQAIQEAAARLLRERCDLPPGSVLRCFARSVRAALRSGCAPSQVAAEAERMAREVLAQRPLQGKPRHVLGDRPGVPRVPRARRAS